MEYERDKLDEYASLLDEHAPLEGPQETIVDSLLTFKASEPHLRKPAVYDPVVVIPGQGRKCCYLGDSRYDYSAGNILTIFLPMPIEIEVLEASAEKPLLAAAIKIDLNRLANHVLRMDRV